ncbi:MAG: flagellar basal body-associated FliL family protein [Deltaproteobacteria bacterium]|nr:flagellar basal body-associated FliL family protein [Deltaproteobacteria bacterium]
MAKKAKLDILEIAPEEPDEGTPLDEAVLEKVEETALSPEQTDGDFRSMVLKWSRRPLFRIVLIAFALLGLAAGAWVGIYQSLEEDVAAGLKSPAATVTSPAGGIQGVPCQGMVVDQRDEKGNPRIVFCDLVLELENPRAANAADGDRTEVRRAIYDLLRGEPAREGLSPEGRGRLKEKLKGGLKELFAGNPVKEVYFTRYEVD